MNLLLSVILFFIQATPLQDLVGDAEHKTQVQDVSEVSILTYSTEFLKALSVDDEAGVLEFIETAEEEEKSESENESIPNSLFGVNSQVFKIKSSALFNSYFTTKAKSGEVPLYTLFHSWKSYLS